jgi:cell division septation protein DedD
MILTRAKWSKYQWKALGVGIKDGYAILWLGDSVTNKAQDNLPEYIPEVAKPVSQGAPVTKPAATGKEVIKPASSAKPKEVVVSEVTNKPTVSGTGTKFYVIVGSYKTVEEANTGLKKIKSKGYPDSFILEGESPYRIAITSFDKKDKADAKRNELKDIFPGIWVYKKL